MDEQESEDDVNKEKYAEMGVIAERKLLEHVPWNWSELIDTGDLQ